MIQGETYVLRWQLQLSYAGKYDRTQRSFVLVFQWKVPAKEFFIKVADCSLPTAILPKMNSFCRFFKIFDKKCRQTFYRWLLLFIAFTQAIFTEKVLYRDLINPTKSTLLLLGGDSLLKEGVMSYFSAVPLSRDLAKGSP